MNSESAYREQTIDDSAEADSDGQEKIPEAPENWRFPLPKGQFMGWIIFFNVGSFLIPVIAIIQVLVEPSRGINPNRAMAVGTISLLLLIYGWLVYQMSRCKQWPLPLRITGTYFIVSILLVCIAWVFHEDIFWLLWLYIGQMFGMLAFQIALPASIVSFGLLLLLVNNLNLRDIGWRLSVGQAIYWVFIVASGFYIYQLFRASQRRGILIEELETTTRQLQEERDKNAELAALKERERLARDMHDGLGHTMAALSVQLEAVQRLYPVEPEKASAMLDDSKQIIRESMDSLRRTLAGLRAPGLGDQPLVAALYTLCQEVSEHTDLQIDCTIAEFANKLSQPVAEALWRVAQESLNNVQNHADAQHVALSLRMGAQRVILEVADDGIGIETNAPERPNRYGIVGMTERMEGLGGSLEIEGSPGVGTTVKASVPFLG